MFYFISPNTVLRAIIARGLNKMKTISHPQHLLDRICRYFVTVFVLVLSTNYHHRSNIPGPLSNNCNPSLPFLSLWTDPHRAHNTATKFFRLKIKFVKAKLLKLERWKWVEFAEWAETADLAIFFWNWNIAHYVGFLREIRKKLLLKAFRRSHKCSYLHFPFFGFQYNNRKFFGGYKNDIFKIGSTIVTVIGLRYRVLKINAND